MIHLKGYPRDYIPRQWHDPLVEGIWGYLTDPHLYELMAPYEFAVEGMGALVEEYNTVIVTNSPEGAREYALNWLREWHIPFNSYVEKYAKWELRGAVLVEDSVANVNNFAIHQRSPALLVDQPWNREADATKHPLVTRVHSWDGIVQTVRRLAKVE
jgi:5'(3')-deoxyribonucleotidase